MFIKIQKTTNTTSKSIIKHMVLMILFLILLNSLMMVQNMDGFGKDCKDYRCNQYYIQINNQTYGPYDYVFDLQFSNDGSPNMDGGLKKRQQILHPNQQSNIWSL
jgi:hypothetical protein